jgi:hypothetical protein
MQRRPSVIVSLTTAAVALAVLGAILLTGCKSNAQETASRVTPPSTAPPVAPAGSQAAGSDTMALWEAAFAQMHPDSQALSNALAAANRGDSASPQDVGTLNQILQQNAAAIAGIEKAAQAGPIAPTDRFSSLTGMRPPPHNAQFREAARLMQAKAVTEMAGGHWDDALRAVGSMLAVGEALSLQTETTVPLVRFAIQSLASTTLRPVVSGHQASVGEMRQMLGYLDAVRIGGPPATVPSELRQKYQQATDLAAVRLHIARTALALEIYRPDHKGYPASLADLGDIVSPDAGMDPFSGRALIYKPGGAGYILYSVGPDRKDDGGTPMVRGGKDEEVRKGDIVWTVK